MLMLSIETEELTKYFGDYCAVDQITFSVVKGEIFGFLGANGAGKTTAIRMLCGLIMPSAGKGRVAGFDIRKEPMKVRRRIGYMPQKFSLYRDLTVRQNMELYGSIYGLDRRRLRERIEAMTSMLSMKDLLGRRTGDLPHGWRQRCALACAELHEPEILFLDEPTGSVDPVSRKAFWDLIINLAACGRTVMVTTHHLDEAEYCHRISIMVDGRMVKIDTPLNLRKQTGTASLDEAFLDIVEKERRKGSDA